LFSPGQEKATPQKPQKVSRATFGRKLEFSGFLGVPLGGHLGSCGATLDAIRHTLGAILNTLDNLGKEKATSRTPQKSPEQQQNEKTNSGAFWGFPLLVIWGAVEPLWVPPATLWVPSGRLCLTLEIVCDPTRDPTAFLRDPSRVTLSFARDPTYFARDPSRVTLHLSRVTLHVSRVTLHFSRVTLHVSRVTLQLSF